MSFVENASSSSAPPEDLKPEKESISNLPAETHAAASITPTTISSSPNIKSFVIDMNEKERQHYHEIFEQFDSNKDGFIDEEDLKIALRKMGRRPTDDDIKNMINIADVNLDRKIDFDEFTRVLKISNFWLQVEVPGRTRFIHLNATTENAIKTLAAGGIAGAVSRSVVSPLERLKILFQTQPHVPGIPPKYATVMSSLQTIWKEEGMKGYFKGNGSNCVRIIPTTAIQFYSYEQFKKIIPLQQGHSELTPVQRLVAGGMAGITALVLCYPLDLARARLTVQTGKQYEGMWHCIKTVTKADGTFAVYKGLWPSILGVVPYVGIDFAVYDTLKRMLPKRPDGTLSQLGTLGCGAIAGTLGQTIAYPLDLVRRRMQVQGFIEKANAGVVTDGVIYKGTWDGLKQIWKTEGFVGLYRGTWPNYLKVVPAISISFFVFENLKLMFHISSSGK